MNSNAAGAVKVRHVLLTGPPGVGKTTLIRKICPELEKLKIPLTGFFTTELREGGRRVGFDVVSLDGIKGPLARLGNVGSPRVGQYVVELSSFEAVALEALQTKMQNGVTVIDEVGKMELFSKCFETSVRDIIEGDSHVLGTIPLQKGKPIPLVEFLRSHPSVKVFNVTVKNRDELLFEAVKLFTTILKR